MTTDDRTGELHKALAGDAALRRPVSPPKTAARWRDTVAKTSLDTLGQAIALIDSAGRLIFANEAAQIVLRRADGLLVRAGLVSTRSSAEARSLKAVIARATAVSSPTTRALRISRDAGRAPYLVTVTPVVGVERRQHAILLVSDPDLPDPSLADRLRSLFGLSWAEASIAAALGKARSLAEIASDRGVQMNTVYVQVKSIMAKMGVSRQAEVAAIVAAQPLLRAAVLTALARPHADFADQRGVR